VTTRPAAFKNPTWTLKRTTPRIMVIHCLTFPQTVMVSAPASLLVVKEETFRQKARSPLPKKTVSKRHMTYVMFKLLVAELASDARFEISPDQTL